LPKTCTATFPKTGSATFPKTFYATLPKTGLAMDIGFFPGLSATVGAATVFSAVLATTFAVAPETSLRW